MASRLEQALARFRRRQQAAKPPIARGSEAFRARVEERLRNLEHQVSEIKGRVNGLIFLVAGTALTQVIIKVLQ
jgi:hypothetical protein